MKKTLYIEKFIQEYRPEFDTVIPDKCHWSQITHCLDRLKNGDALEYFVAVNRPLLDTEWPEQRIWDKISNSLDQYSPTENLGKKDTLESFIDKNRADFDTETPDLRIWNSLSHHSEAAPTLKVTWYRQFARVAAAIALLVVGAGFGLWYAQQEQDAYAGMKMSEVSNEYKTLETQYERDIETKKEQLARFASNPGASEVLGDLAQMDKVMEELRIELSNVPPGNQEQIIRVMIENYKTKSMVLEKVLEAMESQQHFNVAPGNQNNATNYANDTI